MTLASYISCLRIVLIVPIIYLLDQGWWAEGPSFYNYLALVLFVVAGLTDYLDGYIARKTNTETKLGALLDLIADKLLVSLVMVWMVFLTSDPLIAIAALIIVSRELVISTLRQYVIEKKVKQMKNNMGGCTTSDLYVFSLNNENGFSVKEKLKTLYLKQPWMYDKKVFYLNPLYLDNWNQLKEYGADMILLYNNLISYENIGSYMKDYKKVAISYRWIDVNSGQVSAVQELTNDY